MRESVKKWGKAALVGLGLSAAGGVGIEKMRKDPEARPDSPSAKDLRKDIPHQRLKYLEEDIVSFEKKHQELAALLNSNQAEKKTEALHNFWRVNMKYYSDIRFHLDEETLARLRSDMFELDSNLHDVGLGHFLSELDVEIRNRQNRHRAGGREVF